MGRTRLLLVRHAESLHAQQRTLAGPDGCRGLTDRGRRQARDLSRWMLATYGRPDGIDSSPVRRARETAETLADTLGLEVLQDPRLTEPDPPLAPGGESWHQFLARVEDYVSGPRGEGYRWVVTHAGFMVRLVRGLLGATDTRLRLEIENCSVLEFEVEDGTWTLRSYTTPPAPDVVLETVDPTGPLARQALHAYFDDIIGRFHGRPATAAEIADEMASAHDEEFTLLLARRGEDVLGCAGLRTLGDIGEVTRVHVTAGARGQGLGSRLVSAVEDLARGRGVRLLRLDTRSDLVEARRLYARHGFTEVEPFNDDPHAHHFFAKPLTDEVRYVHGRDSERHPDVPRGTLTRWEWGSSTIYPGTSRAVWTYVPAQYDAAEPASLMVFNDGWWYLDPDGEVRGAVVLDNLIHRGDLPPTIAVFVDPGTFPDAAEPKNRNVEYDAFDERYVEFLLTEVLPQVTSRFSISDDPARRGICGGSSGGNAAFTAAWLRPESFGRAICFLSSFAQMPGGNPYPALVPAVERKPLRVFLQAGHRDLGWNSPTMNWFAENLRTAAALAEGGYDVRLVLGDGGHSPNHGGVLLPDALRWAFRSSS